MTGERHGGSDMTATVTGGGAAGNGVLALAMAAGCARGLSQRLAEYR